MRCPDHSTVAEFRRRHEAEIGELFDEVLGLCREAGLVSVGVIAIDGIKIKASASMDQNRDYRELVGQILREAEEIDRREDELYGSDRGDELPEALRAPDGRQRALAGARRRLAEREGRRIEDEPVAELEVDLEPVVLARPVLRRGGRREWTRVARRELDTHRPQQARAVPRDREDRLVQALDRFEENHRVELGAHEAYDRRRATACDTTGRVLRGNSQPFTAPELPEGRINLSDPDSRVMRTKGSPPHQSYNAQAAVNERQIILAAEITVDAGDFGHLEPMLDSALDHLDRHGVSGLPAAVVADAGYWHTAQIRAITERGIQVLVPPDGGKRQGTRQAGSTGSMTRCARPWPPRPAAPATRCARSPSSRSTGRSSPSAGWRGLCEEAAPPCSQSGDWSPPPTTS